MFILKFILEQMTLYWAVYKKWFLLMTTFLKRLCIWQILHVIHFICDKSIQTAREHLYREQKESDFTSPFSILPPNTSGYSLLHAAAWSQTHLLISMLRCVWFKLQLNSAGKGISRARLEYHCGKWPQDTWERITFCVACLEYVDYVFPSPNKSQSLKSSLTLLSLIVCNGL